MADGRVKLFLTWKSLNYRREHRSLFEAGKYLPLEVLGERSDNVCAFERYSDGETVIAVAPRFFTRLGTEAWGDTRLVVPFESAGRAYRNVLTGERVVTALRERRTVLPLTAVLADFPVALLEAVGDE